MGSAGLMKEGFCQTYFTREKVDRKYQTCRVIIHILCSSKQNRRVWKVGGGGRVIKTVGVRRARNCGGGEWGEPL